MEPKLWMRIAPGSEHTRVIAIDESYQEERTFFKARLRAQPSHPRALAWLLEAVSLWQGQHVHAAICALDRDATYAAHFYPDWFGDFDTPLYSVEIVDRAPRRRRDVVRAMGNFDDLKLVRAEERGR